MEISERIHNELNALPVGVKVAYLTMFGTFCPITLAHVEAFVQARRILLGENGSPQHQMPDKFELVLGFIGLNDDSWTSRKLQNKNEPCGRSVAGVSLEDRKHLVKLSIKDYEWLTMIDCSFWSYKNDLNHYLQNQYPQVTFIHYELNGADDVLRFEKWNDCNKSYRLIAMGRSGYTEETRAKILQSKVNPVYCILGPELENISSTKVREALRKGDKNDALKDMIHPNVIGWCKSHNAYNEITKGAIGESTNLV